MTDMYNVDKKFKVCINCYFWQSDDDDEPNTTQGKCYRYPGEVSKNVEEGCGEFAWVVKFKSRDMTSGLILAFENSSTPPKPVSVAFGILPSSDPENVSNALEWAYENNTVTETELTDSIADGAKLTEIVNRLNSQSEPNPFACTITTIWDNGENGGEESMVLKIKEKLFGKKIER